jgi:HD-GYP domain-containing protein (c-di-GMP phosphodiesterase class II)
MADLETVVVRGIQTGIASYRGRGEGSPHLVALLHAGVTRLLAARGALELRRIGHFLDLNGVRFPRGDHDRVFTRRLSRTLRQCGLAGLRLEPGVGVGELRAMLQILGRASLPGDLLCEVPGRLRRAQVVHVSAIEANHEPEIRYPTGVGFSLHRSTAQRLYLRALALYGGLADALASHDTRHLYEIRRVIQRMVELMDEDAAPLLGLTSIKSMESYDLTHAVNVMILAVGLARTARLSRLDIEDVGFAAFLHDVGQFDIPDAILSRQGALSEAEWASMRRHTLLGAMRMLDAGPLEVCASSALVALEHHLGAQGDGYPKLPGGYVPSLLSRIVHIADTFDALTSRRVYRQRSVQPDRALAFMLEDAGKKFDPLLVKQFVRMLGLYPPGTTVRLDTGEVGIVVRSNRRPRMLHRPQVSLVLDAQGAPVEGDPVVDLADVQEGSGGFTRSVSRSVDPEPLEIAPAAAFLSAE